MAYRNFMRECYGSGVFPLWNPYIFGGMPFWAYTHALSSYPLVAVVLLLPLHAGLFFFYAIHAGLFSFATYRFFRELELLPFLSFLGTLFLLANLLYGSENSWLILAGYAWFVMALYAWLRFLASGRRRAFLWFVVSLSFFFSTGDIESIAFGAAWMVVFAVLAGPVLGASERKSRWAAGLSAAGLAVCLVGVMWFPLAEYMPHNIRHQGVTFAVYREERLFAPSFLTLGWFHPLATPLGWFILFFAFSRLFLRRNHREWLLFLCAVLAYLYGYRGSAFLDRLFYALPVLGSFLVRIKVMGGITLLIVFLALAGMQDFLAQKNKTHFLLLCLVGLIFTLGIARFHRRPNALAPLLVLAPALVYILGKRRKAPAEKSFAWLVAGLCLTATQYPNIFVSLQRWVIDSRTLFPLQQAAKTYDSSSRFLMASMLANGDPVLFSQAGMSVRWPEIWGWNRLPPRRYLDLLALIHPAAVQYENGRLAGMDFVFNHMDGQLIKPEAMPLLDLLNLKYFLDYNLPRKGLSPYFVSWLIPSEDYTSRLVWDQWRDLLVLEVPLSWTMMVKPGHVLHFSLAFTTCPDPPSRPPLRVRVTGDQLTLLDQTTVLDCPWGGPGVSGPFSVPLAPIAAGVKKISVEVLVPKKKEFQELRYHHIKILDPEVPFQSVSSQYFEVYQNQEVLPPYFPARRLEILRDRETLLKKLAAASREELASTLFMLEEAGRSRLLKDWLLESLPPLVPRPAAVREKIFRPGRRVFSVQASERALLFLSQNFLPGWVLRVNGKLLPLYRADWSFTAAPVEAGAEEVELLYQPAGFRIGLWVSLTSAAFTAALTRRRKKSSAGRKLPRFFES